MELNLMVVRNLALYGILNVILISIMSVAVFVVPIVHQVSPILVLVVLEVLVKFHQFAIPVMKLTLAFAILFVNQGIKEPQQCVALSVII